MTSTPRTRRGPALSSRALAATALAGAAVLASATPAGAAPTHTSSTVLSYPTGLSSGTLSITATSTSGRPAVKVTAVLDGTATRDLGARFVFSTTTGTCGSDHEVVVADLEEGDDEVAVGTVGGVGVVH